MLPARESGESGRVITREPKKEEVVQYVVYLLSWTERSGPVIQVKAKRPGKSAVEGYEMLLEAVKARANELDN